MLNQEKEPQSMISPNTIVVLIGIMMSVLVIGIVPSFSDGVAPVLFPISAIIFLVLSILCHRSSNYDEIIALPITLCALSFVLGLAITSLDTYRTEVVRMKPDQIIYTPSKVLVLYGDNEFSSTDIKDYNNKKLMVCKTMGWDAWGSRNLDQWSLCND